MPELNPKTDKKEYFQPNNYKKILKESKASFTSKPFEILPNQNYEASGNITVIKSKDYSGYFMVVVNNEKGREEGRFVRWIKKPEGKLQNYKIKFNSKNGNRATVGFRFNKISPVIGESEILVPNPENFIIKKIDSFEDDFDNIRDFEIPIFPRLIENEEERLEKNLVWFMGSERSGTTWIGTRLLRNESNIIWSEPALGGFLRRIAGFKNQVGGQSQSNELQKNSHYLFSDLYKKIWMPNLKKLILNRTYSQVQRIDKNIIIKEPSSIFCSEAIMECFPKSKLIFLLRDGRNVVASQLDRHRRDSWSVKHGAPLHELDSSEKRIRMIKFYSTQWKLGMEATMDTYNNFSPSQKYLIKYENVKRDTIGEVKKLYEFLGLKIDKILENTINKFDLKNVPDSQKGPGKAIRVARDSKSWTKDFSEEEQNLLNSILGETLTNFGYSI